MLPSLKGLVRAAGSRRQLRAAQQRCRKHLRCLPRLRLTLGGVVAALLLPQLRLLLLRVQTRWLAWTRRSVGAANANRAGIARWGAKTTAAARLPALGPCRRSPHRAHLRRPLPLPRAPAFGPDPPRRGRLAPRPSRSQHLQPQPQPLQGGTVCPMLQPDASPLRRRPLRLLLRRHQQPTARPAQRSRSQHVASSHRSPAHSGAACTALSRMRRCGLCSA